ncbi:MAG: hypothetical protein ACLP9L_38940 [Thermoguttaceae bacterium]
MTMLLTNGSNGLFDVLGHAFYALDTLNIDRLTTVPTQVNAVISQAEQITGGTGQPTIAAAIAAVSGISSVLSTWQNNGSNLATGLKAAAQSLLIAYCQQDNASVPGDLTSNLNYLISQMTVGNVTGGDHVTAITPTVTATTGGSSTGNTAEQTTTFGTNSGTVCIAATLRRGDGQLQANALAETIALTVQTPGASPMLSLSSPPAVTDATSYLWPGGSGLSGTLKATSPQSSLLTNGSFTSAAIVNQPDNWIIATGTPGTTLILTQPCQQTVTIAGSPTAGSYVLEWVDAYGQNRATAPLPYTATQSQVQQALQAIAGLSQVTVSSVFVSGSNVNVTHTITFTGVGGAVSALTYISNLSGGSPSITVATTTAADSNTLDGTALKIVSSGSTNDMTLYSVLPALTANTTYFLGFRIRSAAAASISAGALKAEILNGIGGSVIADAAGNTAALTVDLTTATGISNAHWTFLAFDFRVPPTVIQPVYLRLRLSTAITSGQVIYLDDLAIVAGTQLYSGGPIVAAFGGGLAAAAGDVWSITVTNTMSCKLQKDFNRFFGMANLGLLLPTVGSTSAPAWASGGTYTQGELATNGGNTYACIVPYTNNGTNSFATDLAAGHWQLSVISDSLVA